MGIAGTDGNKIYVWGERMSSKLENFVGKDRYENLIKLKTSGEKIYFKDNEQENSKVQSPNE